MEEPRDGSWARIVVASEDRARERPYSQPAQQESGGVVTRLVRGERCVTRGQLFEELSSSLDFPGYFGRNWDALDEVLGDMLMINFGGWAHTGTTGRA